MTLTYTEKDGLLYPDLSAPPETEGNVTKYGMLRSRFLKEHNVILYNLLRLRGELKQHLIMIQEQADDYLDKLVMQMAEQEEVTEELKALDPFLWVKKMNSIQNRAEEIVLSEIVYA